VDEHLPGVRGYEAQDEMSYAPQMLFVTVRRIDGTTGCGAVAAYATIFNDTSVTAYISSK
jgi:hypothetical protein